MVNSRVTYDRLVRNGSGAVNANTLRVSNIDARSIEQAIIDASNASAGGFKVEFIEVDAGVFAAKEVQLAALPFDPAEVVVHIIGGTAQLYGADYTVVGDVLDWAALGMDTPSLAGKYLLVMYSVSTNVSAFIAEQTKVEVYTGFAAGEVEDPLNIGTGVEYFDLSFTPNDPDNVRIFIAGGTIQVPNMDFEVIDDGSGDVKRVNWAGLVPPNIGDVIDTGTTIIAIYGVPATIIGAAAANINVDSSGFTNIPNTVDDVQEALDEIDILFDTMGGGGSGEITKVEYFTTTATDMLGNGTIAGNMYVSLSLTPSDPSTVRVYVSGGTAQQNALVSGTDYTVVTDGITVKRIDWSFPTYQMGQVIPNGTTFEVVYTIQTTVPDQASSVLTDPFTGVLSAASDVQGALNIVDAGIGGGGDAASTVTDITNFSNILGSDPPNVQLALDILDNHTHTAEDTSVMAGGFAGLLSPSDNDVQQALETLDLIDAEDITTVGSFTGNLIGDTTVQEALNTVDNMVFSSNGSYYVNECVVVSGANLSASSTVGYEERHYPLHRSPLDFDLLPNKGYLIWHNIGGDAISASPTSLLTTTHCVWDKTGSTITNFSHRHKNHDTANVDIGVNGFYAIYNSGLVSKSYRYKYDITPLTWTIDEYSSCLLKMPLHAGMASSLTTTPAFLSNPPANTYPLSTSFGVSNSANKVLILASFADLKSSSTPPSQIDFEVDGVSQREFRFSLFYKSINTVSAAHLYSPGNTSAHTYRLNINDSSGSDITSTGGQMALLEVDTSNYSSVIQTGSGGSGYTQNVTVNAGNRLLILVSAESSNPDIEDNTDYVLALIKLNGVTKTTNTLTNGENSSPHVNTAMYISDALTAGTYTAAVTFTTFGTTIYNVSFIAIEIPG